MFYLGGEYNWYVYREPGRRFRKPCVMVFFVRSMVCGQRFFLRFVDISGIVDHHCLHFFSIVDCTERLARLLHYTTAY